MLVPFQAPETAQAARYWVLSILLKRYCILINDVAYYWSRCSLTKILYIWSRVNMETCDERWRINPIHFLNLRSKTIPRCLWSFAHSEATIWSLKKRGGCASRLLEKSKSIACLVGSGLKNLFPLLLPISIRSWFNSDADTFVSGTIENSDVSSAKNLTCDFILSSRSFM